MFKNLQVETVYVNERPYQKQIILADVNIPYKLSLDRRKNKLFFCINADEFSDQSFHSVCLDLGSGSTSIIPGIRNGFASAIDQKIGTVYLGGSNGIFIYDYSIGDIVKPPLVNGIDIFDMYFLNDLYYIDTCEQNLHVYKDMKPELISEVENYTIQHFVVDGEGNIVFMNASGLHVLNKDSKNANLFRDSQLNYRGAAVDNFGTVYLMTNEGVYSLDKDNRRLNKIISLENGFGLAFDKDNNIVYSDERTVNKLIPLES